VSRSRSPRAFVQSSQHALWLFMSDLLDAGQGGHCDGAKQKLDGHTTIQMMARYDRRGEVAKKKAASLLHVPYTRRAGEEIEIKNITTDADA